MTSLLLCQMAGLPLSLEPQQVRALHLGAYAYHTHPAAPQFRADYLQGVARHALTRRSLLELVRAWNTAGLEPLLLKGFALAEFEYEHPAHRFYGDVDVYLSPQHEALASGTALALGWRQFCFPETGLDDFKNEMAMFYAPDRRAMLELHGSLVKARRWSPKLEQFTALLLKASTLRDWEGTRVRTLAPADALIFCLLDRTGDRWGRKVFDFLDARVLIERHGLTRRQLDARARQLGCAGVLRVVWRSFDPWEGMLKLTPPTRLERWSWSFAARGDFGFSELERVLQAGPRRLRWALVLMPEVLRAWITLRRTSDLRALLERIEPPLRANPDRSSRRIQQIVQGCKWALVLLGWTRNACVPRSLAIYAALRREGHRPQFVSGVRRDGARIVGHAWVELKGSPLLGSGDELAPKQFAENFRHPPIEPDAPGAAVQFALEPEIGRSSANFVTLGLALALAGLLLNTLFRLNLAKASNPAICDERAMS